MIRIAATGVSRVIVVGVDGLGGHYVKLAQEYIIPNLRRLMNEGNRG